MRGVQVFEIKAGSSVIQRIWVMGAFAQTYEAGVHWYTNDLNLWQPEFNRIGAWQQFFAMPWVFQLPTSIHFGCFVCLQTLPVASQCVLFVV